MTHAASLSSETLQVFESMPGQFALLSPELNFLVVSGAFLAATYKTKEQLIGKHLLDVFPPMQDGTGENDAITQLLHSLKQVLTLRKADQTSVLRYDLANPSVANMQEERYWTTTNTPVLNEAGEVCYIIHESVNVTHQLKLERQLIAIEDKERLMQAKVLQQHDLLQALLTQAPVAMSMYEGTEQVITTANPLMCRLWGRTSEQVIGKPLMEALPELKGQGFDQLIQQVYKTGVPFVGKETPARMLRNGQLEINYYNFVYQPLYNEQGSPLGVLNVAVEVTELVVARKQVEESERKLSVLNNELTAANKEILASNEELRQANQELLQSQQALRDLNYELEERIKFRTKELQLAQTKAELQSKRLESLFMQAPAAICILEGPELVYGFVNPDYQQFFPDRQLIGKPILEALPEIRDNKAYTTFRSVYETGITHEEPEMLIPFARPKDGVLEDRYFRYIQQARYNELGQIDGVVVFALEVTHEVEIRKAAEQSAESLQLITDSLPVLIGYLDKEEKYRFANKAYEAWFNQNPKKLLGRPVRDVIGEKAYLGVQEYIRRALAGERLDFESRMPYREDFVKYIRTSYVPDIRDGKVQGFYTLVTDVTEQTETRQKIEESEKEAKALAEEVLLANEYLKKSNEAFQILTQQQQQLVALVENSTDFIGLATPEGRGVYINKAGLQQVGLDNSQVEQVNVLDFFDEKDKPFAKEVIIPTILQKGRWSGEFRFRNFSTGVVFPVHYNCFSIKDPETGELLGLASITIDITERKKQEAELQALTRQLAAANEELSTTNEQLTRTNIDLDNFIYTASHDLKAPIANIEGLILILNDSLPDHLLASQGLEGVMGMIAGSIKRFKRTIDHLTEVTKLQKENNQEAVLIDIADVISEVQLDLSPQLEAAGAQLEVDVDACSGISFSEKNLRSVVYNLISNAVKYASPERSPKVQVNCHAEGGYTVLTVKDNGLGMDLNGHQKLFTMFGRLHDHVEGSGIGLYMVKKIVENAGGRIEVESHVNVGSTFTVFFKN